ncbi:hypothetical protein [Candidatus Skiveiella danica]|uniref:hypothetical protein n=1 Tax=Candidatus Skiveiella danica TaxID=3386177 RepID=UPI0039B8C63F
MTPSPIAAFTSGEGGVFGGALRSAPMPIAANLSRIGFSTAAVPVGGANCSRKSRYSAKPVVNISGVSFGQLIAGAAGGAGLPRNVESGCSL